MPTRMPKMTLGRWVLVAAIFAMVGALPGIKGIVFSNFDPSMPPDPDPPGQEWVIVSGMLISMAVGVALTAVARLLQRRREDKDELKRSGMRDRDSRTGR